MDNRIDNRAPRADLPEKLAIDAAGYCWRVFPNGSKGLWSMARINPDNSPIPDPVTFYVRQDRIEKLEALLVAARQVDPYLDGLVRPAVWDLSNTRRALLDALAALDD